jgi:hypothetical protein
VSIITLTKQGLTNSQATRQGSAFSELLEQTDPPALCFGGPQDAINFARDGIQDANRRAAFDTVDVVKSYMEGNIHIVLQISFRGDPSKYDAIFVPLPSEHKLSGACSPHLIDVYSPGADTYWHKESVFVGVTKLVDGPEGIIPSLVWLERSKERTNFWAQIPTSPFDVVIQSDGRISEGKISILGVRNAAQNASSIATLIQAGSEGFDGLDGRIGPTIGDVARKFQTVDSKAIRLYLSSTSGWVLLEEYLNTLFESANMFLCAGQPALGALEGIRFLSHGEKIQD